VDTLLFRCRLRSQGARRLVRRTYCSLHQYWLWRLWVCGRRRAFPRLPSLLGKRGKRSRSAAPVLRYVTQTLLAWAMRKFKRFAAHKIRGSRFLQSIAKTNAELFVHWRIGMTGTFAWMGAE